MESKRVTFTLDTIDHADAKTYPESSMKPGSSSSLPLEATHLSSKTEQIIHDIYFRYRSFENVDVKECLGYILAGNCSDNLISHSVLNLILRDSDEQGPTSAMVIGETEIMSIISQSTAHFDEAKSSGQVRDTWILQQIMRTVEQAWMKSSKSHSHGLSDAFLRFSERCISLVGEKSGSKTLLSPAVRLTNLALEDKVLTPSHIGDLIKALSRSRFAFASSFINEVIQLLVTVHRISLDSLNDSESAWIPLAVRALGSSSSYTRSNAVQLLQYHVNTLPMPDSPGLLAACLTEPVEPSRPGSETLHRIMLRKMMNVATFSLEDAKMMTQAWVAIMQSALTRKDAWPQMGAWMDLLRIAFAKWPKLSLIAWRPLTDALQIHHSYSVALPVLINASQYADDLRPEVPRLIVDAVGHSSVAYLRHLSSSMNNTDKVRAISNYTWETLLEPTLQSLSNMNADLAISGWARVIENQNFKLIPQNIPKYLEVLMSLTKRSAGLEDINHTDLDTVWSACISAVHFGKARAMDLVKFHYNILSEPSDNLTALLTLTNRIITLFPEGMLSEKPKNSSFEYLTLILLPIVTFKASKPEYLDNILSSCKSRDTLKFMIKAALGTVETGGDQHSNQKLAKWSQVARVTNEYMGATDQESTKILSDVLLTFIPLMHKASVNDWRAWEVILSRNREVQQRVVGQLKKLPLSGLRAVLSLPKTSFREEKLRLLKASFSEEVFLAIRNDRSLVDTEMLDSLARSLASQNSVASARWAASLLAPSQRFVIAKPLLNLVEENKSKELVEIWNKEVGPQLQTCPPFLLPSQAARLKEEVPSIKIPDSIVRTTAKRHLDSSPTAPFSKRPRMTILTGTVHAGLTTPPASSDFNEDRGVSEDLCSSPPARAPVAEPQTWKNALERARTLKRVMMGFDMEEATQTMKRSEKQMIYNLMFKSCVWLKTHLADTGDVAGIDEVEVAKSDLEKTLKLRENLQAREDDMIERGKRRAQEALDQDAYSDDDILPSDELDSDDFENIEPVKLEVI